MGLVSLLKVEDLKRVMNSALKLDGVRVLKLDGMRAMSLVLNLAGE